MGLYMRSVPIFSKTETCVSIAFTQKFEMIVKPVILFVYRLHCTICLTVLMALKAVEIVLFSFESTM